MRLAILCTHPIQYYAPAFAGLAACPGMEVKVFYGWRGLLDGGHDREFGKDIRWDIPLLDGYDYEFIVNVAKDPGTHHFRGIDLPGLIPAIEEWGAEALMVYGWSWKAHLQSMRWFHGKIPVYFRGDSTLLDKRSGLKQVLRRLFLRWVYHHVDTAFHVGTQNRRYYRAMGMLEKQLVWAPHAIDNARFSDPDGTAETAAKKWRHDLEIPENALVVLFCGKFEEKKAPEVLLMAHDNVHPPANLFVVFSGSGIMEPSLRQHASSFVRFLGFQNQTAMPTVYRMADIVALPSRGPGETWGLAINEAMACGRPIAVSDKVGSAADLVKDNANGWVFQADNVDALANVMQQAIAQGRSGLHVMGQESLRRIQKWSIDVQVRTMASTIQNGFPI